MRPPYIKSQNAICYITPEKLTGNKPANYSGIIKEFIIICAYGRYLGYPVSVPP